MLPRFKNHPILAALSFLALSLVGVWAMGSFFNNMVSTWTWLYTVVFVVVVVLLSVIMRWAERDIQEYREEMKQK